MVAGRGVAQMVGQNVPIRSETFNFLGNGHLLGLPVSVSVVAIVLVAMLVLTRLTALGLFVESVGNNPRASRFAGLPARPVAFSVYAISGLCAGIAGLIIAGDIGRADANKAGLYLELDAILAVVVGGTALAGGRFTLLGSILGALLIQTLTTTIYTTKVFGRGIPPDVALVVKAAVVLGVCLLQSPDFRRRLLRRRG
jgi:simple sugar transport system permease protein